jgi:hypothetical protein
MLRTIERESNQRSTELPAKEVPKGLALCSASAMPDDCMSSQALTLHNSSSLKSENLDGHNA